MTYLIHCGRCGHFLSTSVELFIPESCHNCHDHPGDFTTPYDMLISRMLTFELAGYIGMLGGVTLE